MPESIPESAGVLTGRGLISRLDGRSARVTRRAGAWGWWENGRRTEPFATREEAAADFMVGDRPLLPHQATCHCGNLAAVVSVDGHAFCESAARAVGLSSDPVNGCD